MHIDLFSDTVCPWCRIGKRHLELALAEWARETAEPVTLRYRSFFLDPTTPPEGRDFRGHMTAKGGGRVPLEQFFAAPRERGQPDAGAQRRELPPRRDQEVEQPAPGEAVAPWRPVSAHSDHRLTNVVPARAGAGRRPGLRRAGGIVRWRARSTVR